MFLVQDKDMEEGIIDVYSVPNPGCLNHPEANAYVVFPQGWSLFKTSKLSPNQKTQKKLEEAVEWNIPTIVTTMAQTKRHYNILNP